MILNRDNRKKGKKEIKKRNEEEEEEEQEEEEEEKETKKKIKKHKKQKKEIEEEDENEEVEDVEEEYVDEKINIKEKIGKKFDSKNKLLYIVIACAIIIFLLILIIFLVKRNNSSDEEINNTKLNEEGSINNATSSENSPNQSNKENKEEKKEEENPDKERISNDLKDKYNQDGYLNINKFCKENILKQEYKLEDINRKPNQIHINVAFKDIEINTYLKHISSILNKADKDKTFLHIHMMDAGEFNYDSFLKISKMLNNINNFTEIIVYNANPALKDFNIRPDTLEKFGTEYAKLYAFKILKDIQKIIFLDSDDLMVQKDLSELYELKMDDIYARGIAEEPGLKNQHMDWYDKYIMDKSHYINGGVMLINLELCQRDNIYEKAIELNNKEFYMKTESPMQDLLNVLFRKKIEFFHPKFNKINFYENPSDKDDETKWYTFMQLTIKLGEKNNHIYTKEELMEADRDPTIIHYYLDKSLDKTIVKYEEEKKEYAKLCELNEA